MKLVAIGVLAAVLVFVPSADARRPTTKTERAQIARVFHIPAACTKTYVSTVDRRYASYEFRNAPGCTKYGSNGIDILKRSGSGWKSVGGMSDCTPNAVPHVPAAVYRDLTRHFCGT